MKLVKQILSTAFLAGFSVFAVAQESAHSQDATRKNMTNQTAISIAPKTIVNGTGNISIDEPKQMDSKYSVHDARKNDEQPSNGSAQEVRTVDLNGEGDVIDLIEEMPSKYSKDDARKNDNKQAQTDAVEIKSAPMDGNNSPIDLPEAIESKYSKHDARKNDNVIIRPRVGAVKTIASDESDITLDVLEEMPTKYSKDDARKNDYAIIRPREDAEKSIVQDVDAINIDIEAEMPTKYSKDDARKNDNVIIRPRGEEAKTNAGAGNDISIDHPEIMNSLYSSRDARKNTKQKPVFQPKIGEADDSGTLSKSREELGLKLYPNPAVHNVTIDISGAEEVQIEIIDITGKLVDQMTADSGSNNKINLNVSVFDAGVYFVRITDGMQALTQRLVIK